MRSEVSALRSRLKLNSKNSHKPPSSDGLQKRPGLPRPEVKKSGGQVGHKGRTLKMVETPDRVLVHDAFSGISFTQFRFYGLCKIENKRKGYGLCRKTNAGYGHPAIACGDL